MNEERKRTCHKASLTVKYVDDEPGLTQAIGEHHEKQHGQNSRTNELENIDAGPHRLVFVVEIFVPGGVRHSVVDVRVVCESNSKMSGSCRH